MAAIGGGCGGGSGLRMSGLGQNESVMYNSKYIDSVFISGSSSSFMGCSSMVSFEDVCGGKMSERPFFGSFDHEENGDEDLDDYFQQPAKKRRLTTEQVQFLERSFEAENKLEPERKIQLAKDLGLQPRQVAIWFQNRRARWKTKRLEKDYDALQASYNSLKADYENLLKEKEELKAEVLHLTDKMQLKGKEQEDSDPSNTQNILPKTPPQDPIAESASEVEDHRPGFQPYKQEDLSSTRSDVFDSEYSPRYIDGGHSSFEEPGDSSYVFEPAQSDVSLDEESDNLSKTLLPPSSYDSRMIRTVDYHPDPPSDSCNFGFTVEDQALWFWAY